jgi:phage shock protein C
MDQKKLCRSRGSKMLCGVCGGVAEYINIDPTVVRLLWAVLSIVTAGGGVLLYIIAAFIMPERN